MVVKRENLYSKDSFWENIQKIILKGEMKHVFWDNFIFFLHRGGREYLLMIIILLSFLNTAL